MKKKEDVVAKVKAKAKSKVKTNSKAKAKSKIGSKAKTKVKVNTKAKAKTETKVKTQGKKKSSKSKLKVAKPSSQPLVKVVATSKPKTIEPVKARSLATEKVVPLDDRVVVRLKSRERKTPGGLFIPDTASLTGNFEGVVIAVGRGHQDKKGRLRPLQVNVGDEVMFAEWAGTTIQLAGEEVRILRESELLGTLV